MSINYWYHFLFLIPTGSCLMYAYSTSHYLYGGCLARNRNSSPFKSKCVHYIFESFVFYVVCLCYFLWVHSCLCPWTIILSDALVFSWYILCYAPWYLNPASNDTYYSWTCIFLKVYLEGQLDAFANFFTSLIKPEVKD